MSICRCFVVFLATGDGPSRTQTSVYRSRRRLLLASADSGSFRRNRNASGKRERIFRRLMGGTDLERPCKSQGLKDRGMRWAMRHTNMAPWQDQSPVAGLSLDTIDPDELGDVYRHRCDRRPRLRLLGRVAHPQTASPRRLGRHVNGLPVADSARVAGAADEHRRPTTLSCPYAYAVGTGPDSGVSIHGAADTHDPAQPCASR